MAKSNPLGSRANSSKDYRVMNARKRNKEKYPNSDIYIFKMDKLGLYKIGVSQNINRRIKDINSANPYSVNLYYSLSVNNAYDLEYLIHNKYEGSALQNEWFELTDKMLSEVIDVISEWQKQPIRSSLQYKLEV
jgi:hypothetical protein